MKIYLQFDWGKHSCLYTTDKELYNKYKLSGYIDSEGCQKLGLSLELSNLLTSLAILYQTQFILDDFKKNYWNEDESKAFKVLVNNALEKIKNEINPEIEVFHYEQEY